MFVLKDFSILLRKNWQEGVVSIIWSSFLLLQIFNQIQFEIGLTRLDLPDALARSLTWSPRLDNHLQIAADLICN